MIVETYSSFRKNLKGFCDKVVDNEEELIVSKLNGKHVVVMSLDKYERMMKAQSLFELLPEDMEFDEEKVRSLRKKLKELKETVNE